MIYFGNVSAANWVFVTHFNTFSKTCYTPGFKKILFYTGILDVFADTLPQQDCGGFHSIHDITRMYSALITLLRAKEYEL